MPTVTSENLQSFIQDRLNRNQGQTESHDERAKKLAQKNIEWTNNQKKNAQLAADALNEHGFKAMTEQPSGNKIDKRFAAYGSSTNGILVNPRSSYWKDPIASAKANHESGHLSSDHPLSTLLHEVGHTIYEPPHQWMNAQKEKEIAGQVGRYAASNPKEFVSEVFAAKHTGKELSPEVMNLYNRYANLIKK